MLRVLLVDDDRDRCQSTARLLRRWGHEVLSAHDCAEAVAAAGQFLPDAVLLGLALPPMEGCELGRQIQRRCVGQPVIVGINGYGQDEDRRADQAGFGHRPVKSAEIDRLKRLLQAIQGASPAGGAPVPAPVAQEDPTARLRALCGELEDGCLAFGRTAAACAAALDCIDEIRREALQVALSSAAKGLESAREAIGETEARLALPASRSPGQSGAGGFDGGAVSPGIPRPLSRGGDH